MSLPMPQIPENATESYLEKVAEKIHLRLDESDNVRVRERLNTLLATVEERRLKLHQQARTEQDELEAQQAHFEQEQETPLELLKSTELSEKEQQSLKKRLKNVLTDIRQQHSDFPQETMTFPSTSPVDEHEPADDEPAPSKSILAKLDLSQEDYGLVKERMAEMLRDIKRQHGQHEDEDESILELGPEQTIELGPEQEIEQLVEQTIDLGPEFEISEAETLQMDAGPLLAEAGVINDAEISSQQAIPSESLIERTAEEESGELTFPDACRRISQGEALVLLEKVGLSEREKEMLAAFGEHLTQMKGLKRQQVFEMQHITSRSIRELEQIFKTYHLQGYLRAELNNIYNRLLNLRSRFSILQH